MTTPGKIGTVQVPPTEKLPDGLGGPVLRAAVMKGDAAAAYEIASRFAEGKGVPVNLDEARNGLTARRRPAWCPPSSGSEPSTRRA